MELNKNSKWIKFYLKFNYNRPINFCDYFWGSLKSISVTLFLLIMVLLLISCLLSPIMLLWEDFDQKSKLSNFQIFGIAIYITSIAFYIFYKLLNYFENKSYKPYKESIIKVWYRDFKNKHCTLITWK